jgi:hypothetical protein
VFVARARVRGRKYGLHASRLLQVQAWSLILCLSK